ncbi:Zinc finger- C6HC-type [Apiospora hydei]|uniref:Zinc finger- C6HC-type n=1 Tax=Apiospora hydei TaxID=1337664 RepID=A0ABR1UTX3_9PEZI
MSTEQGGGESSVEGRSPYIQWSFERTVLEGDEGHIEDRNMEDRPDSPEEECSCGEDDEDHTKRMCCILCTEHSKEFVVLPCTHVWCKKCLRYPFSVAYNGGFGRPPRCCDEIEPTPAILECLGPDIASRYLQARMEHYAAVTAYCHSCLEFVPEPFVVGSGGGGGDQLAACPKCKAFTCVPCGKAWHAGDCAEDADVNMTLKLAKKKGWRQCPKCKTVIEHKEGCNEML